MNINGEIGMPDIKCVNKALRLLGLLGYWKMENGVRF